MIDFEVFFFFWGKLKKIKITYYNKNYVTLIFVFDQKHKLIIYK